MRQEKLFEEIKKIVFKFDSEAQIILYGSRARGNYTSESDWDFLILFSQPVSREQKSNLRHYIYDIELEIGEILSIIFDNISYWKSEKNQFSSFYKNVESEGIII